jgi:5-methylcytosine-specific restriction endonuclease McrA
MAGGYGDDVTYLPGHIKARLRNGIRKSRRESLYRIRQKLLGVVRCFVCGGIVKKEHATLEHITPLSKGGTDDWENLAISHADCNAKRGAPNE